jgi:hypothetical protein
MVSGRSCDVVQPASSTKFVTETFIFVYLMEGSVTEETGPEIASISVLVLGVASRR